jgi:hypothetical protein
MSDMQNPIPEEMEEESAAGASQSDGTIVEELTVAGNQLVKEVERLINEGNVRRLIIKQDDKVLMEVSLTLGVVGAGALAIFAPLPAVAALAAAVARVTVVIVREGGEVPPEDDEPEE